LRIKEPERAADPGRGAEVYAQVCAATLYEIFDATIELQGPDFGDFSALRRPEP
jgi:hypothetical protein